MTDDEEGLRHYREICEEACEELYIEHLMHLQTSLAAVRLRTKDRGAAADAAELTALVRAIEDCLRIGQDTVSADGLMALVGIGVPQAVRLRYEVEFEIRRIELLHDRAFSDVVDPSARAAYAAEFGPRRSERSSYVAGLEALKEMLGKIVAPAMAA